MLDQNANFFHKNDNRDICQVGMPVHQLLRAVWGINSRPIRLAEFPTNRYTIPNKRRGRTPHSKNHARHRPRRVKGTIAHITGPKRHG